MSEVKVKVKNEAPEPLPRDEMIERINEMLQDGDYTTVYMIYVILDCEKKEK